MLFQDLNIGIALWLAAGGDGWLYQDTRSNVGFQYERVKYKSMARILLVGSGADEQCAGYGRHKTKFRNKRYPLVCRQLFISAISYANNVFFYTLDVSG